MKRDEKLDYYFYDVNAKLNHRFSDRSRLFLNFYKGEDYYKFTYTGDYNYNYIDGNENLIPYTNIAREKQSIAWGNMIASARLNLIFSQKLFANMTAAYNQYQMNSQMKSTEKETYMNKVSESNYFSQYKSGIRDWNYMIDFDYSPVPTHNIKFGASYQRHNFHPEIRSEEHTSELQ